MSNAKDYIERVVGAGALPSELEGLPDIPETQNRGMSNFLSALKRWVAAVTGEGLDSFLSRRALLAAGLASTGPDGSIIPLVPNMDVPPAPTDLAAVGAMTHILLSWDGITYLNHAYTEIFSHTTNNLAAAVLIGTSSGRLYADAVGPGQSRYYWVRFVSTSDIRGPWNATAGTLGTTSDDPAWLLSVLAGQLTETELYATLNARINLIDGPDTDAGTVAYRVLTEANARMNAVAVEAEQRLQGVEANSEALLVNLLGWSNETGARVADIASAKFDLTADFQAGISAEAVARLELQAATVAADDLISAAVLVEESARTSAVEAEATQRTALATQFRGDYAGNDLSAVTTGLIYQERVARANAVSGLSQDITLLSAGVGETFDYSKIYYFDGDSEDGWVGNGTSSVPVTTAGWLRPANHGSVAGVASPTGLAVDGSNFSQVRLRIRKYASPTFAGYIYWNAAGQSWDNARRTALSAPTYDANNIGLVTVDPAWSGVTIDQIRIDLSAVQDGTNYFTIDWIAIGRPAPGASNASVLAVSTAFAAADDALASDILTLETTVNDPVEGLTATKALLVDSYSTTSTADSAAAAAQTSLLAQFEGTKSKTFRQSSPPAQGTTTIDLQDGTTTTVAKIQDGDLWIDTDDDNKIYAWLTNAWVVSPDESILKTAAFLDRWEEAVATATGSTVTSLTTLLTAYDGNEFATTAAVTDEINTLSDATTALAQQTKSLVAGAGGHAPRTADGKLDGDAELLLNSLSTQDAMRKLGITELAVAKQDITASVNAGISAEATARLELTAVVDGHTAEISQIQTAYTDADSAFATDISQLEVTAAASSALITDISNVQIGVCTLAGATTDHKTRTACEAAGGTWTVGIPFASSVKQVSVNDGSGAVALEQRFVAQKTTDDGLLGMYSLKIDVNGYVSGFGLSSEVIDGDTPTSTFIASVDKFAIAAPEGSVPEWNDATVYAESNTVGEIAHSTSKMLVCKVSSGYPGTAPAAWYEETLGAVVTDGGGSEWQVASRVPFYVLTSGATINGVACDPGVYIDGALIVNASINKAQIGLLAVDDARIYSVKVDKLLAGTIIADQVYLGFDETVYSIWLSGTNRNIVVKEGGNPLVTVGKLGTGDYGILIKDGSGNTVFRSGTGAGAVSLDWDNAGVTGTTAPADNATVGATIGTDLIKSGGGTAAASDFVAAWNKVTSSNVTTYIDNVAITNAQIAALDAAKITTGYLAAARIEAGSIAAEKLSVSSLSAVSATIGTLKSAETGARLEVTTDVIRVYDSAGTLRVKLGNLA